MKNGGLEGLGRKINQKPKLSTSKSKVRKGETGRTEKKAEEESRGRRG